MSAPGARRILLLSTYEVGAQPVGLSAPAAALRAAGHEVAVCDLSVEELPPDALASADGLACSVPMHTALRLLLGVLPALRAERPGLRVCLYGLYAPAALESGVLGPGDAAVAGDIEGGLCRWAESLALPPAGAPGRSFSLPPRPAPARARTGVRPEMAPLGRYARLLEGDRARLVGTLEASVGCNHRCRHCPVPVVFGGRSRPLDPAAVLEEVDELVGLGATHLHFSDPDFLNRPRHSLALARAISARHRGLTFDATVKVSHILRHLPLLSELAGLGLSFVISAFESTSPSVLAALAKGHTEADAGRAVDELRRFGVEVRPSFLPFTPWTTRADLPRLFDFVAEHDLISNVDPVQYAIRLLLPPGSLLLEGPDPVLAEALGPYDPGQLSYTWRSADPLLDELQGELAAIAGAAGEAGAEPAAVYGELRRASFEMLGRPDPGPPARLGRSGPAGPARPRLSEAWFCCAEPTSSQFARLGHARK